MNYIFNCDFLAHTFSPPSARQRIPPDGKNKRETVFRRRRRRRLPSPPLECYLSPLRRSLPRVKSLRRLPPSARGLTFTPYLCRPVPRPLSATAARLHGPPLSSVQQVARSFKTCRRSFVRFKKAKHRQSSALRRQDRYPRREEDCGTAGGWKREVDSR